MLGEQSHAEGTGARECSSCGALEPLFAGKGRVMGLIWKQVKQCHSSCCHMELPSAQRGPCSRAGGVDPVVSALWCTQVPTTSSIPTVCQEGAGASHMPGWDIP